MEIIRNIASIRKTVKGIKGEGKTIGLVPTMGALHKGHISLIEEAVEQNDITIATIFVNPIQFNNPGDLKAYPASFDEDIIKLEQSGCDYVFAPSQEEMYRETPVLTFNFGNLETTMEGAFRPGHFCGVALVVIKLFNILQPTNAYFGQKDLQQFKVIEKLIVDTSLEIDLKMMPIIREESGLALSSRNVHLSEAGKAIAPQIYMALKLGAEVIRNGGSLSEINSTTMKHLNKYPGITTEYLNVVNLKDLQHVEIENGQDQLVLCFAGYIDEIRLIDNIIIN